MDYVHVKCNVLMYFGGGMQWVCLCLVITCTCTLCTATSVHGDSVNTVLLSPEGWIPTTR